MTTGRKEQRVRSTPPQPSVAGLEMEEGPGPRDGVPLEAGSDSHRRKPTRMGTAIFRHKEHLLPPSTVSKGVDSPLEPADQRGTRPTNSSILSCETAGLPASRTMTR